MNRIVRNLAGGLLLALVTIASLSAVVRAQENRTGTTTEPAELTASVGAGNGQGIGIVADLSTHTVAIRTDFAGTRVLLFGALVRTTEENKPLPGIVVVIHGPEKLFKMHRKRRVLGVWVNRDERIFPHAPGYYAILSNEPLAKIADSKVLYAAGVGYDVLEEQLAKSGEGFASPEEAKTYAEGLIRLQRKRRLYQEDPEGVKMTGRYLFRAQFDLPANVPLGTYRAKVYLFRGGKLLGTYDAPLTIEKKGFEQFVFDLAHKRPLVYGVAAVIIAIAAGFLANAIFRKD